MSDAPHQEPMDSTVIWSTREADPAQAFAKREFPFSFCRYVIEQHLGGGSMGEVFLARDTQLKNRPVALKIPTLNLKDDEQTLKRFQREAGMAALLNHRHICKVFDVGQHDGVHYLTMEFVAGITLGDYLLKHGPLPCRQAAEWTRDIAFALHEAHRNGVIHRDLKPGNVMLRDETNEPVIMDFGLARLNDASDVRQTLPGDILGTPAYMSPEQFSGDPDKVTAASDLFSLGVILYEMLTGQRPFAGTRPSEVILQIATQEPRPLSDLRPDVDAGLAAICQKMLQKDPQQRFASAKELAAALDEYLRHIARLPTVVARSRRLPILASAALVVSVGWVIWSLQQPVSSLNQGPQTKAEGTSNNGSASTSAVNEARLNGTTSTDSAKGEVKVIQSKSSDADADTAALPTMEIHLQRAAETRGYRLVNSQQVPIRDGDKLHIHVKLSQPTFVYLFWYDALGVASQFWPKLNQEQQAVSELWCPDRSDDPQTQEWHKMGGDTGLEMILAATSDKPLSDDELIAFQNLPISMAHLDADKQLALFDQTSGTAVLLVPQRAEREMVVIASLNRERERGQVGVVKSPKGIVYEDFTEQLSRRFQTYYGLVFPHAK